MEISKEQAELLKKELVLTVPKTEEELRNWIKVYLGLDMPDSHLKEDGSNSSPMEAIWISYKTYLENSGDEFPGYVWLSSRDAGKTLSASILAVVLMVFFDATICWLASIEPQSKIALNNVQSFIQKISSYLAHHGKKIESNNSRNLEIVNSDGTRSLVNILVATMASVNGKHVNVVMTDEVDLLRDPRVLDEVQAVASLIGNQFPLKLYFSTRKFAFGNMEKIIRDSEKLGLTVLKWDILDVTEHCPVERRKSQEKTEEVYVHPDPPLRSLTEEKYQQLAEMERKQYQKIKVYPGCLKCKLVSQCRTRLADRSPADKGVLWKKIDHTINMFRSMSPDMAEAQLLCRKPSFAGLVYPRFEEKANAIDVLDAYRWLTGENPSSCTYDDLVDAMLRLDTPIYVSGDWGHVAAQAFVVSAIVPGGDWWILESYSVPGLEFDEVLKMAMSIRDRFKPRKWFMDTAQPMFIKTFNKNGMKCAEFKKDVAGGIEAVRTQIVDASGKRKLKVIKHSKNDVVMECFRKHHYKLDSLGNVTGEPDDGEPWSDTGDSIRYFAQNMFAPKANSKILVSSDLDTKAKTVTQAHKEQEVSAVNHTHAQQMFAEISSRATQHVENITENKKNEKKIVWDF